MATNKLFTIGRLTADAETRDVSGRSCTNFTLASDTKSKNAEGKPNTNFYRCSAWGKTGEVIAQYAHKGDKISIVGDLDVRQYKDNNGVDRTAIQLTVSDFEFISTARSNQNAGTGTTQGRQAAAAPAADDDDLPF